jgi:hypothetical protein
MAMVCVDLCVSPSCLARLLRRRVGRVRPPRRDGRRTGHGGAAGHVPGRQLDLVLLDGVLDRGQVTQSGSSPIYPRGSAARWYGRREVRAAGPGERVASQGERSHRAGETTGRAARRPRRTRTSRPAIAGCALHLLAVINFSGLLGVVSARMWSEQHPLFGAHALLAVILTSGLLGVLRPPIWALSTSNLWHPGRFLLLSPGE